MTRFARPIACWLFGKVRVQRRWWMKWTPAWGGALRRNLATWRDRARGRHLLRRMSDRQLEDIGLTRFDADREARKPFWRE